MNDADLELFSHEDIDRDIERVYKAYCDATLLGHARETTTKEEYWKEVVEFRRRNFGPVDRAEFVTSTGGASKVVSPEDQAKLWAKEGPNFKGRLEFLYWFDVRAHHWSELAKDKIPAKPVVTPGQLDLLLKELAAAQQRMHEVKRSEWPCRKRNDEILKNLDDLRASGLAAAAATPSRK